MTSMTRLSRPIALLLALSWTGSAGAEEAKPDAEGFAALFNGRDMTGWEGKPGWWRVEDGALTGQSTPQKPCKKHNYLMWRGGRASDFELKLQYRIVGGNSGIGRRRCRNATSFVAGEALVVDGGGVAG